MVDTLISVIVQDADGDRRSVPIFLPAATTQAAIVTFDDAFTALLDAVIDGVIVEANYTINLTLPGGLKGAAVAASEVQKGANISFLNGSRYKHNLFVPTWTPTKFSGDNVDLAGGGVAAFLAAYTAGLGGTNPTNGYAFDLTAVSKARKSFRK